MTNVLLLLLLRNMYAGAWSCQGSSSSPVSLAVVPCLLASLALDSHTVWMASRQLGAEEGSGASVETPLKTLCFCSL